MVLRGAETQLKTDCGNKHLIQTAAGRERGGEKGGNKERERWVCGGRGVYGLLNARLTTGGRSSVDPIKTKQNGGSVQPLCDLRANNAAVGRGGTEPLAGASSTFLTALTQL